MTSLHESKGKVIGCASLVPTPLKKQSKTFIKPGFFVMTVSAPRGSGKSYLVGLILDELYKDYDHVIIMSPSHDFNDDYYRVSKKPNVKVISDLSTAPLDTLIQRMEEVKRLCVKRKRRHDSKKQVFKNDEMKCPSVLLVLDDIIDSGVVEFRGAVDKIAERGRHINISSIICTQRTSAVSRSIRINSTYFLFFSPFSLGELERFLDEFVSRDKRKQFRESLKQVFDIPHRFVILDNTESRQDYKLQTSIAQDFVKGKTELLSDSFTK